MFSSIWVCSRSSLNGCPRGKYQVFFCGFFVCRFFTLWLVSLSCPCFVCHCVQFRLCGIWSHMLIVASGVSFVFVCLCVMIVVNLRFVSQLVMSVRKPLRAWLWIRCRSCSLWNSRVSSPLNIIENCMCFYCLSRRLFCFSCRLAHL